MQQRTTKKHNYLYSIKCHKFTISQNFPFRSPTPARLKKNCLLFKRQMSINETRCLLFCWCLLRYRTFRRAPKTIAPGIGDKLVSNCVLGPFVVIWQHDDVANDCVPGDRTTTKHCTTVLSRCKVEAPAWRYATPPMFDVIVIVMCGAFEFFRGFIPIGNATNWTSRVQSILRVDSPATKVGKAHANALWMRLGGLVTKKEAALSNACVAHWLRSLLGRLTLVKWCQCGWKGYFSSWCARLFGKRQHSKRGCYTQDGTSR